jgi:hypothetical protein
MQDAHCALYNHSFYYSGHKIVLIIRTEVTEDSLPGLSAWEPLNGLSNNGGKEWLAG